MSLNYTIEHNGSKWSSINSVDSLILKNGNVTDTITTTGTRILNCANKIAANNIVVGDKTLNCAGKVIKDNIIITTTMPVSYPTRGSVIYFPDVSSSILYNVVNVDEDSGEILIICRSSLGASTYNQTTYEGSNLQTLCESAYTNNTWGIKDYIVAKDIMVGNWGWQSSSSSWFYATDADTPSTYATATGQHIYPLDIKDIRDYYNYNGKNRANAINTIFAGCTSNNNRINLRSTLKSDGKTWQVYLYSSTSTSNHIQCYNTSYYAYGTHGACVVTLLTGLNWAYYS